MLLIDAHVHIYDCFDLADMFDAACENFSRHAKLLGGTTGFQGILLLTESREHHFFAALSKQGSGQTGESLDIGNWQVANTSENTSLRLSTDSGENLLVIAGRQLVSIEGLEVLALATASVFEEGVPASALIEQVADAGGVPVLPWAFGKWLGKRGKVLQQLIQSGVEQDFYLGDNGGRPSFCRYPSQLRTAVQKEWKVLSGTDPLPLAGEEVRVGSFGIYADSVLGEHAPAGQLRELINNNEFSFEQYGSPMNVFRFMRNQMALRGL